MEGIISIGLALKDILNFRIIQPHYENICFLLMQKTKAQISGQGTVQLISTFVFPTYIVQSHYFPNRKFQASSHLLWSYSKVTARKSCCNQPKIQTKLPNLRVFHSKDVN